MQVRRLQELGVVRVQVRAMQHADEHTRAWQLSFCLQAWAA